MSLLKQLEAKKIYGVFDTDLDGVGARTIAEYYLNPIAKVVYLNTNDREMSDFEMKYADASDIILFTDITPTLDLYNELIEKGKTVILADHHQTGRDTIGERENYYFDITKCGCKILYNELSEGLRKNRVMERFVHLVNTYDMWKNDTEDWMEAKGLHNAMWGSINWKRASYQTDTEKFLNFILDQLQKFKMSKVFYFTEAEKASMKRAIKKEQTAFNEAKRSLRIRTDNEGDNYGWFSCTSKLSFVANRLLDELDGKVRYVVGYSTWDKKNTKVSLRCKNDFSVNHIAEKHGGGGHTSAAGVNLKTKEKIEELKLGRIHLI